MQIIQEHLLGGGGRTYNMTVAETFAYCHIYEASINVLQSISHAGTDMEKPNFHPFELLLQPNSNHRFIQAFYYITLFINLHIVLLIVLRTTYFV